MRAVIPLTISYESSTISYEGPRLNIRRPANNKNLCNNENNHRYLDVLTIKVLRLIETVCVSNWVLIILEFLTQFLLARS